MHTNTQNTECPVGYSVYFPFNYICIKYVFICKKKKKKKKLYGSTPTSQISDCESH